MTKVRKFETEAVLCVGETDFFKEVLFTFDIAPAYIIEDVNVKLENVDLTVAKGECNTVIFNGNLFINVVYKNINEPYLITDPIGRGPIRHQTKIIPISGCIPVDCEKIKKCGKDVYAKLVDVCILENHILTKPQDPEDPFPAYDNLREQVCIKIKVKVVTDEIVSINLEDEEDKHCKC